MMQNGNWRLLARTENGVSTQVLRICQGAVTAVATVEGRVFILGQHVVLELWELLLDCRASHTIAHNTKDEM